MTVARFQLEGEQACRRVANPLNLGLALRIGHADLAPGRALCQCRIPRPALLRTCLVSRRVGAGVAAAGESCRRKPSRQYGMEPETARAPSHERHSLTLLLPHIGRYECHATSIRLPQV